MDITTERHGFISHFLFILALFNKRTHFSMGTFVLFGYSSIGSVCLCLSVSVCVCDRVLYYLLIYSSMLNECSAGHSLSTALCRDQWPLGQTVPVCSLLELVTRPHNGHYVQDTHSPNSFIFPLSCF